MNSRTFNRRMPKRYPVNPADQNIAQWTLSVSRSKFVERPHPQQNTRQLLRSDTSPYAPPALKRAVDALACLKRGRVRPSGGAQNNRLTPPDSKTEFVQLLHPPQSC